MSASNVYPLIFRPVWKHYVWGGRNLERIFGRQLPDGNVAESWEIAAHPSGTSHVANGSLAGRSLLELYETMGNDLIGDNSEWAHGRGRFPLLIKLLDAQQKLSVQVHPDDSYAQAHEHGDLGKSEMWVVLNAEPGAAIVLGVTKGTTREAFKEAAKHGQLEPYLHHVQVSAGDFVCVPSGTLHAILGGLVIAEIQQNSDLTYRVYDWGRDNENRPLHIPQALDVINFDEIEPGSGIGHPLPAPPSVVRERLCRNNYFTVERQFFAPGASFEGMCDGSTLEIWGAISGHAEVASRSVSLDIPVSRFVLLPATLGPFVIRAVERTILLRTYVEKLEKTLVSCQVV